jgi:diguanylate cyclase (GGDEF)-like protein/PAS domain S-box-containing protein
MALWLAVLAQLKSFAPLITIVGAVVVILLLAFLLRSKLRAEKLVGLLHGSEQRFRTLAASSPVGILQLDSDGRCIYANARFKKIVGLDGGGALEPGWRLAVHPEDREATEAVWTEAALGKNGPPVRFRIGEGSEQRWGEARAATLRDDHGAIVGCVGTVQDITERERIEAQLTHHALHDPVTGLPNRTLFLDRVGMALARTRRSGGETAVLFIDLDRFKLINDSLGHEAGDRLLTTVAERLNESLRDSDSVGRLGGDEFAVLCEVRNGEEAMMIAERTAASIEAPVDLDSRQTVVSASIGIALSDGTSTPAGLLENADAAMYRAKESGKARVEMYDESMRARTRQRLQVESALREAIEKEQLVVFYQAVLGLVDGEIVGAEALVRWRDPVHGLISPGTFIPVAEETGMILPLGAWVLREACREAARLGVSTGKQPRISVNLSTRQLAHPGLVGLVADTLEETGLDPGSLCLEITETALMQDADRAIGLLEDLKALGVSLSLDDFGTGYSSLSYLRRFPVDEVKVDRSFVDGLVDRPGDASIVAAVRDVTRTLGLGLVAEGIETREQLERLQALGYEKGQGFLFARPGPREGFEELLRGGGPWLSTDMFTRASAPSPVLPGPSVEPSMPPVGGGMLDAVPTA